jgi:hypothetical protein
LKELYFHPLGKFNQQFGADVLPSNLKLLRIGEKFNTNFETPFPQSLQDLIINNSLPTILSISLFP